MNVINNNNEDFLLILPDKAFEISIDIPKIEKSVSA